MYDVISYNDAGIGFRKIDSVQTIPNRGLMPSTKAVPETTPPNFTGPGHSPLISMATAVTSFQEQVRGTLTQQIAQRGYASSNDELASLLDCTRTEIEEAIFALHSTHSLLLHLHKPEPWVVHPFSLYPSACWIQVGSADTGQPACTAAWALPQP